MMRRMGIEALYRRPRTSIPARDAKIYPYLLVGLAIERPNHVWAADLTYLPMAHGFLYLVAILDVASRKVLSFRVSNTMTPDFCVEALTEAIARYGAPEIVNTDQGSQFRDAGSTTSSSRGCGGASSTKISTCVPTRTDAPSRPG
jgi:putative transposase